MRIAVPNELMEYIKFRDGQIIILKEIPEELSGSFKKFKKDYEIARERTVPKI